MATVRKYKPKGYFRGGRVLEDVPIEGDAPDTRLADNPVGGFPSGILGTEGKEGAHLTQEPPPAETSLATDQDNPLQRALDAQRRAEELSPIAREIDKLPLSEFKKSFLKAHPDLITDEFRSRAMGFHWNAALQAGIQDDTPEMNAAILQGVDREIAHVRQQAIENVRMPVVSEPEPAPSARREELPAPPMMPPPPARRSMPISAPVSRDVHMPSGQRQSDSSTMTLTEEERRIARTSYSAPGMTDAQKEYAYATNKRKLQRLRQSGEYPESERN